MGESMKKTFDFSVITIACLALSSTLAYGIATDMPVGGSTPAINTVAHDVSGGTDLIDLHNTSYTTEYIGHITLNNNDPDGFEVVFESKNVNDVRSQNTSSFITSRLLMSSDLQGNALNLAVDKSTGPSRHFDVEGLYIPYTVTIAPRINGSNFANSGIHGCFTDLSTYNSLGQTGNGLHKLTNQSLTHLSDSTAGGKTYIDFDLTDSVCTQKINGVTATADFQYDVSLTTTAKNTLLGGNFTDTITVTVTDL
jgi:hypothetical protein